MVIRKRQTPRCHGNQSTWRRPSWNIIDKQVVLGCFRRGLSWPATVTELGIARVAAEEGGCNQIMIVMLRDVSYDAVTFLSASWGQLICR